MAAAENIALLYEACWRYGGNAVEQICGADDDEGSEESLEDSTEGGESVRRTKKADRLRERTVMRNALKTVCHIF